MSEEEDAVKAVYEYKDGHREKSDWCKRAGVAVVKYSNGDIFEGRFSNQREKEGQGVYTYTDEEGNKSVYQGNWKNSKRNGFGVMKYANGDVYEGMWKDGVRSGQGTYRYANGDVFSGDWSNDEKHGSGAYVFSNPSSQLVGVWQHNECVRGKWITPNLSSFHGHFSQGKPIGPGVFYHPTGIKQQGVFNTESKQDEETADEGEEERGTSGRIFVGGAISLAHGPSKELVFRGGSKLSLDSEEDYVVVAKRKPVKESKEDEEKASTEDEQLVVEPEVQQEIDAIESLFKVVDVNNDGQVDLEELVVALSSTDSEEYSVLVKSAPQIQDKEKHMFFKDIDTDGSGKLSLNEFREYFYLLKLFNFVDADASGQVRHGELRAALSQHPEVFPPHFGEGGSSRLAVSALMSVGDLDQDRLLSFPEFVHMMLSVQDELDSSRVEYSNESEEKQ